MAKHYDNKKDLLRKLKQTKEDTRFTEAATFTAYMSMALYVLANTFDYSTEQAEEFVDAFYQLNSDFNDDKITLDKINQLIEDKLGMAVEGPSRIAKD